MATSLTHTRAQICLTAGQYGSDTNKFDFDAGKEVCLAEGESLTRRRRDMTEHSVEPETRLTLSFKAGKELGKQSSSELRRMHQ